MHRGPVFERSPASRLAWIGPAWTLIPLRIPTGWAIHWNTILARALSPTSLEANDSEDLFWAVKLPPPDGSYSTDPTSRWREIHVDAGWYRDRFQIAMLDPDWDHVRRSFATADLDEFIDELEDWLAQIADDGDVRPR